MQHIKPNMNPIQVILFWRVLDENEQHAIGMLHMSFTQHAVVYLLNFQSAETYRKCLSEVSKMFCYRIQELRSFVRFTSRKDGHYQHERSHIFKDVPDIIFIKN